MLTQALLVDDSRSVLNFLKRHIEAEGLVEATTFLDEELVTLKGDLRAITRLLRTVPPELRR